LKVQQKDHVFITFSQYILEI